MKLWLRLLYFSIPALTLALSVLALNSERFLLRPLGDGDNVPARLEQVSQLTAAGQWAEAGQAVGGLQASWEQVRGRVRLTLAANEIETFDMELAGLQGAVDARDDAEVRIAYRKLRALWDDFRP